MPDVNDLAHKVTLDGLRLLAAIVRKHGDRLEITPEDLRPVPGALRRDQLPSGTIVFRFERDESKPTN